MLPFVLAAQLALIHGKVFISHQLQGRSQTKVKETFSSRQVSTDNIKSRGACTCAFSLSLSVSFSFSLVYGNIELGSNIEILMMKVTFMLIKVLLINPSWIRNSKFKFAYFFRIHLLQNTRGPPSPYVYLLVLFDL